MPDAVTEAIALEPPGRSGATRARSVLLAATALACPLVFALVVAIVTGNMTIPHNDAWAYSKIAAGFADDFTVRLVGWNRSGLVGQTLLAAPLTWLLGNPLVAQHSLVWTLALVLVVVSYTYFRPVLGPTRAWLVAATVAVFPGLGLLATSFMADIPGASLGLCCLLLGAWAGEARQLPGRLGWLAASLLVGWLASTSREQALAAPVAVVLWFGFRALHARRRPEIGASVLLAVGYLGAFVGTEWWRQTLPGNDPPTDGSAVRGAVRLLEALPAAGLVLFPLAVLVVVASSARAVPGRLAVVGGLGTLLSAGLALAVALDPSSDRPDVLLPGNFVSSDAPYLGVGVGPISPLLPVPLLLALEALGGGALAVLLVRAVGQGIALVRKPGLDRSLLIRGRLGLALGFLVLSLAGLALQTLTGQQVFERYALPWVTIVAGLLLAGRWVPTRGALQAFGLAAASLAVLGAVLVAGAAAHDTARWEAGTALTANGIPAADVNAGFEWTGWHATSPLVRQEDEGQLVPWAFPGSRNCWVVASGPVDRAGFRLSSVRPYERLLVAWPAALLVYEYEGCAAQRRPVEEGPRAPR